MKGAVVHFDQQKLFGFIRDENGESRYFQLRDIQEKDKFIDNLEDYYYTEYVERRCFMVAFSPAHNGRSLAAKSILLTEDILNDKTNSGRIETRITDVRYEVQTVSRISSGYKKGQGAPPFSTAGSNGTYRIGYPETSRELLIDFIRTDDLGWGTISARKLALYVNDREKITESLVEIIKQKITGKTARVIVSKGEWFLLDMSILKI